MAAGVSASPLVRAAADPGPSAHDAERARAVRAELDRQAARLEIRASQSAAWNEYSKVVIASREPLANEHRPSESEHLGAVELMRDRAQRLQAMAQRLTQLAEATQRLAAVLSPEQKDIFDQIIRSEPRYGAPPFGAPPSGGPAPRFGPRAPLEGPPFGSGFTHGPPRWAPAALGPAAPPGDGTRPGEPGP
ncbi:MAG TPA: Spy/CpxP family protein refolding chaperone [Steroidobacteraceae bacterium]|nr:Spy/CpxP family protein refolding chaperone [Steroidobacteraceae bacterium]